MKKDRIKDLILDFLGVFFLIWGIAAILNQVYLRDAIFFLWLCYIGLILIGLGILFRSSYLIASQIAILTIPLLIWSADFIYFLIFRQPLSGITLYFFENKIKFSNIISLQHLFTIPLSLLAIWMIKLNRKVFWKFGFLQITIFFMMGRFFTPANKNINCVFRSCFNTKIAFLPYFIEWFITFFLIIIITNFILMKIKVFRR